MSDGCIYYSNLCGNALNSMNTDGTDKQKLCGDCANGINVVGNRIYYSNYSDGWKLYAINTDGSDREN